MSELIDIPSRIKFIRGFFLLSAALGAWFDVRPALLQDLPSTAVVLIAIRIVLLMGYLLVALRVEQFLRNAIWVPKAVILGNVFYRIAVVSWIFGLNGLVGRSSLGLVVTLFINSALWSLIVSCARDLRHDEAQARLSSDSVQRVRSTRQSGTDATLDEGNQ